MTTITSLDASNFETLSSGCSVEKVIQFLMRSDLNTDSKNPRTKKPSSKSTEKPKKKSGYSGRGWNRRSTR